MDTLLFILHIDEMSLFVWELVIHLHVYSDNTTFCGGF